MGAPWTLLGFGWSVFVVAGPQVPATSLTSVVSSLFAHQQEAEAETDPEQNADGKAALR